MHERAPLHGGIVRPRTALAAAGCHGTCDRAIAPPSDHPFEGAIQASHPLRDDHPYKSTRPHTDPVRLSSIAAVDSDRWRASIAVTPSTLTSALPWGRRFWPRRCGQRLLGTDGGGCVFDRIAIATSTRPRPRLGELTRAVASARPDLAAAVHEARSCSPDVVIELSDSLVVLEVPKERWSRLAGEARDRDQSNAVGRRSQQPHAGGQFEVRDHRAAIGIVDPESAPRVGRHGPAVREEARGVDPPGDVGSAIGSRPSCVTSSDPSVAPLTRSRPAGANATVSTAAGCLIT